MHNISLDSINPSNLKKFFKALCVASARRQNKYKTSVTGEERELKAKIYQLENELHKTRKERDIALLENRNRINELNGALIAIKTVIHELLEAKKRRINHLERKIGKEVRI